MSDLAIGIHLGNTNSSVAVFCNSKAEVLRNSENDKLTRSFLFFTDKDNAIVGKRAKELAETAPELAVFDIKRLIGRKLNDPVIAKYKEYYPFELESDVFHDYTVKLDSSNSKTITELCTIIFRQLKIDSEVKLVKIFDKIVKVVITTPKNFTEEQNEILTTSARNAGFQQVQLLHEPIAVAKCHISRFRTERCPAGVHKQGFTIICILGGTSCTVSILQTIENNFQIIRSTTNDEISGINFDIILVNHYCEILKQFHGIDPNEDKHKMRYLFNVCEKAKQKLSFEVSADIILNESFFGNEITVPIMRADFENLIIDKLKGCIDSITASVQWIHIQKGKIREIMLCGGGARIPKLKQLCKESFRNVSLHFLSNPDECVTEGAAVYAAEFFQMKPIELDLSQGSSSDDRGQFTPYNLPPRLRPKKQN